MEIRCRLPALVTVFIFLQFATQLLAFSLLSYSPHVISQIRPPNLCTLPSQSPSINRFVPQRQSVLMISHGVGFNRLDRAADQRKALLRSLTTAALRFGRIRTTLPKAKALRKPVDHMITLAKRGTLHARRQAYAYIYDKGVVQVGFAGCDTWIWLHQNMNVRHCLPRLLSAMALEMVVTVA